MRFAVVLIFVVLLVAGWIVVVNWVIDDSSWRFLAGVPVGALAFAVLAETWEGM